MIYGEVTEAGTELSSQRSLFLPGRIRRIEAESFAGLTNIRQVWIPDGAETIGEDAFSGCGALLLVRIPASVKSIGTDTFSGDTELCILTREGHSTQKRTGLNGLKENRV